MTRRRMRAAALLCLLLAWGLARAPDTAAQIPPAGRVIAVQGRLEVERAGAVSAAALRQALYPGDLVRTGAMSRAAILLADESRVKLNANSTLRLKEVAPRPARGIVPVALRAARTALEMVVGEVWVQTSAPGGGFEIETPAVTASIRGTEFNLAVAADGESRLALIDGVVDYRNPFGAILLRSGELGIARIGQAPQRQILLNPDDAVQWSLYYPGIVSPRDYPLVSADRGRLQALLPQARAEAAAAPADLERRARVGEILHDLGQRDEARDVFAQILAVDPAQGRALAGLGWVALERGDPRDALARFRGVTPPAPQSLLGLSLAQFRLGDLGASAAAARDAVGRFGPSPAPLTQLALTDLLIGEVARARQGLDEALALDPTFALAHGLVSNIALTLNRKADALAAARRAVEVNPNSPSAHLDLSLALQAQFDLEGALRAARQAVALDPGNARAHIQVARLLFGFDRGDEALAAAREARALDPNEPLILATLGFILLARGETAEAVATFQRALDAGATAGDPYLGLGLAAFRGGQAEEGLQFIEAAVLLEPRVSLFQSYLGKGLYQAERREEALTTLDRARTLDPRDPTPYLYAGVFLRDLNRPAEAIAAFQQSVALNDNRAVYRSRFLLDRDLATRNVDLTKAYAALGQADRALVAGIRALQEDPQSSSAHLFYASVLGNRFGNTPAALSEQLLFKLLAPVNPNTFNTFNDYTILLEQPRLFGDVEATIGSFDTQEGTLRLIGGNSRVTAAEVVTLDTTDGPKPANSDRRTWNSLTLFKWAPTPRSSLFLSLFHTDLNRGDTSADQSAFTENSPNFRGHSEATNFEAGYQAEVRPEANLLLLAQGQLERIRARDRDVSFPFVSPQFAIRREVATNFTTHDPFYNAQAAYLDRLGSHQIWLAADFFRGEREADQRFQTILDLLLFGNPSPVARQQQVEQTDTRNHRQYLSLVLQDTWQLRRDLFLTGALRYDDARDGDLVSTLRHDSRVVSPQGGLVWRVTPEHALRVAAFRSFQTHGTGRLLPAQIAGFVVDQPIPSSSDSREFHGAWDADLTSTTFLTLEGFRRDVETPVFDFRADLTRFRTAVRQHRTGGKAALNQILGQYFGLSLGYLRVHRDDPVRDGDDDLVELRARFVHPTGLSAGTGLSYVRQDLGPARPPGAPEDFWVASLDAGYEFPEKRGAFTVSLENIFRKRFQLRDDSLGGDAVRLSELPDFRFRATLRLTF